MRVLIFIVIFLFLNSCKKENTSDGDNRLVIKSINNGVYKATLFKKSTISDITSYVSVVKDDKEYIVFHGNFGAVIDIYFKGEDTLYLKCYKPSSNITYEYKKEVGDLKVLKDTLITDKEYKIKTH